MSKIAARVEFLCECRVTYEDPRYTRTQVVDRTAEVRRDGKKEPKFWGPPVTGFQFLYSSSSGDGIAAAATNLESIVSEFNLSRIDGVEFRITRSDGFFHLIPRDPQASVLGTHVTTPLASGTAYRVIRAILAVVSSRQNTKIGVFGMERLLERTPVHLGNSGASARDLLARVLSQVPSERLSWKLLYDYGLQAYILNVHRAPSRSML